VKASTLIPSRGTRTDLLDVRAGGESDQKKSRIRGDRGTGHAEPLSRDGAWVRSKTTAGRYRAGEPMSLRQHWGVGKHL